MGFSHLIMQWYGENKRDLPWRHTNDPYLIWVSEIILQQTRVEQGLAYYQRFVERFPDVRSLAQAEEEEVMKIWQGLGYYTRARNMHQAAKTIYNEHRSGFPASYDEILKMRGVGDYSASAISSIAYGEPHPVVDGNVLRVTARFAGIAEAVNTTAGRKKVKGILANYIDRDQPGIFNQAIMELGALICKPRQPLCMQCPVRERCYAYSQHLTNELPMLNKPRPSTVRYFHYLVILERKGTDNYTWIRKRTGNDIWKNLYDFPHVEADHELLPEDLKNSKDWINIAGPYNLKTGPVLETTRHILSHRELRVKFILFTSVNYDHPDYLKINIIDINKYPVPRLIENFLKKIASRPGIFFNFPD